MRGGAEGDRGLPRSLPDNRSARQPPVPLHAAVNDHDANSPSEATTSARASMLVGVWSALGGAAPSDYRGANAAPPRADRTPHALATNERLV
jgi:hypothetical protein